MTTHIICPSGLAGEIRGLKGKEGKLLSDRSSARAGATFEKILAGCWLSTTDPGLYELSDPVGAAFHGLVDGIRSALDRLLAFVGRVVAKIPERFRPAFLDSIIEAGEAAQARIAARAAKAIAPAAVMLAPGGIAVGAASPVVGVPGATMGVAAAGMTSPAAAEIRARGQIGDAEIDAIVARGLQLADERPVHAHVTLSVDGETLARATARANRSSMARSFVPAPVGG